MKDNICSSYRRRVFWIR